MSAEKADSAHEQEPLARAELLGPAGVGEAAEHTAAEAIDADRGEAGEQEAVLEGGGTALVVIETPTEMAQEGKVICLAVLGTMTWGNSIGRGARGRSAPV